jgi:hypothetical protein
VASLISIKVAKRKHFNFQPRGAQEVRTMRTSSLLALCAVAAVISAIPVSPHWLAAKAPSLSVDTAQARVGRPLTPMSVAGVNRRVHRRAYVGAAAAAGAAGYGYYNYNRRACGYYPYGPC